MTKKKTAIAFLCLTAMAWGAYPQDQLTLALDDPLYRILEICAIRGIIPPMSAVKPYTIREIDRSVELALQNAGLMSEEERSMLEGLKTGYSPDESTPVKIDAGEGSSIRFDFSIQQNLGQLAHLVRQQHRDIRLRRHQ
jgi:hypothetical protein